MEDGGHVAWLEGPKDGNAEVGAGVGVLKIGGSEYRWTSRVPMLVVDLYTSW